ncbi:hypothetical protein EVG20_g9915 [Dentipellis fragilis]|uniref:Uncharacterized protein n=1 Tax=Dentipellis fragilis TaxID=205917 RepID=A0A4Y9XZ90_9AGAM|nr:hypothetical protein EVG20_g9915 [Dentipellis fragilis]
MTRSPRGNEWRRPKAAGARGAGGHATGGQSWTESESDGWPSINLISLNLSYRAALPAPNPSRLASALNSLTQCPLLPSSTTSPCLLAHLALHPPVPSTKRHSHSYLTHPHHSHFSKYSPSSRAADISRLLDPSYLSSSSTSSSPASVSAYVDHHGDLHDPDYRDFPALPTSRRPAWERGASTQILDDEELYASPDEDAASEDDERTRLRASTPRDARRRRHAHEARLSTQYSQYSSYASAYTTSPFEETIAAVPVHEKRAHRKLRSKSHPRHARDDEWAVAEEEREAEAEQERSASNKEDTYVPTQLDAHEWTPTCTQQFRRHWQAFSLSLRFSIFRAQRRMKRKVGI